MLFENNFNQGVWKVMQDYFGFALFCSVIDIENLLNHLESFWHCHLYLLLQPVFFPLSSQQPLVFSSAFVGCYDYFSFGFTALNQSAFNFFKIMSSLGNQYQYLDPTAEEMDNGFVFSPVSLISSFSTIFVKPFFGSHNRWSIII